MTETKVIDDKTHFKNFVPDKVENEWLSAGMIIQMLFRGFPYKDLPSDVQAAVDAEMLKRHGKSNEALAKQ